MVEREWVDTGAYQHINPSGMDLDRIPDFDPRTGDHFWMVSTGYKVNPELFDDETHTPILDRENLVTITGAFCFHCEQLYSKRLASRRCKGSP